MGTTRLALLVFFAVALRFVHLDADPDYYGWLGHVNDEGRWVEHARNLSLHGALFEQSRDNYHFWIAPIFTAATWFSFEAMSVGRLAARIFPAICGGLLVLLVFAHLRRSTSLAATLLGLGAVAFQADFFVLSRVAVPEMPVALASFATYLCIVTGEHGRRRLFCAGLFACAMAATKLTSVPLVAIFAVGAFARRPGSLRLRDGERWKDVASYAAGVMAVAGVAGVFIGLAGSLTQPGVRADLDGVLRFVQPRHLGQMAKLFFRYPSAPVVNICVLAAWVSVLGWLAKPDADPRRVAATRVAAIWAALFALLIFTQRYFPARYVLHILMPVSVLVAVGADRLRTGGVVGLERSLHAHDGLRRAALQACLMLPTTLFLVPPLAAVLAELGAPMDDNPWRSVLMALAVLPAVARGIGPVVSRVWIRRLIGFPIVATFLWFAGWALAPGVLPWWPEGDANVGQAAAWCVLLAVAAVATGGVSAALARNDTGEVPVRLTWAAGIAVSAVWLAHLAPGLVSPHFSVRDASRQLATLLAEEEEVLTRLADGLFLDNELTFRRFYWFGQAPERFLVTVFPVPDRERLERHYELVHRTPLFVSDAHWNVGCQGAVCREKALHVDVYRSRARSAQESGRGDAGS